MVTRLRGNGDKIWEINQEIPKNCYLNLEKRALDENRDELIFERAKVAKYEVLRGAKTRY
jgi:hypothetical protein